MRKQLFYLDIDVLSVLPWHKDSAPNLRGLLERSQAWYDKYYTGFWNDWRRDVFCLDTANDFGLNIWAIILNLPLFVNNTASAPDYPAWGFEFNRNFDNGNFATSYELARQLTTEQRRQLLKLRWHCITSDGTMHHINTTLKAVFGDICYCLDGQNMTIRYIFVDPLPLVMVTLLNQYDLLPRPNGVRADILINPRGSFGFDPYGVPFDQYYSQFGVTK